jgi:hypothetical protein
MERHTVQSPKFILRVVWNPIGFHVPCSLFHVPCSESPPEGAQIQCTILYYYINDILVAISNWRRQTGQTWQTGVTRPNKLWVHSDNIWPRTAKMSRNYIDLNRMKQAPHPPIRQFNTFGLFLFAFWLCQRKADEILR